MPSQVRIFSYLPNPRVWKSTIAGRLAGVEVEVVGCPSSDIKNWLWDFDARPLSEVDAGERERYARTSRRGFAGTALYKTDQFLELHPFGTVPAAFSADGKFGVFESNSIMRLVARLGRAEQPLYGSDPFEASRIDSFLDAGLGLGHDVQRYVLALAAGSIDRQIHAWAEKAVETYLSGVERALTRGATAIVGDRITLADICFACELALLTNEQRRPELLESQGLSPVLRGEQWAEFPKSLAHFDRLISQPVFSADFSAYAPRFDVMRRISPHPPSLSGLDASA